MVAKMAERNTNQPIWGQTDRVKTFFSEAETTCRALFYIRTYAYIACDNDAMLKFIWETESAKMKLLSQNCTKKASGQIAISQLSKISPPETDTFLLNYVYTLPTRPFSIS